MYQRVTGIVLGIIVFVILYGTLNYFNIIPFSKVFPFLSFLPQKSLETRLPPKQTPLQTTLVSPTPTQLPAIQPPVICKRFTDLSEALQNIDIACVLDLSGQNLGKAPADITKLTKLNDLSLANNNLTTFPSEILAVSTLISLDLSNNKISSIPQEITNLKNLQSLNLKGNPISEEEKAKIKNLLPK